MHVGYHFSEWEILFGSFGQSLIQAAWQMPSAAQKSLRPIFAASIRLGDMEKELTSIANNNNGRIAKNNLCQWTHGVLRRVVRK